MFDLIIVGGGHAGIEAAYISSQFDLNVAIISMPGIGLASAPCNPAIGGVGKGQVVKEIDCLGGLVGKLADISGIQYRTLNESKGYAVQSTRVQIDKVKYSKNAHRLLEDIPNITIIFDKVLSVEKSDDTTFFVKTSRHTYSSKKIIMTVGTFLNGRMHTGSLQVDGGREECDHSDSMGDMFKNIKTISSRFKTGTPPRLDIRTIDFSVMEEQKSDDRVPSFHFAHSSSERFLPQVICYLAYTNSKTLKIIRDNKDKSPMFNGQIDSIGARYCPSIEDKAFRYPDKDVHHIFIEPESLELNTVYPSGVSTSLPKEIQDEMMKTILGLENCQIANYGYAVEYDVIDTTQLNHSLEMKSISGLYFAGQVNGTSGYEEASAQGYIAGVNASLVLNGLKPLVLSRNDSYIGVLIEDLISNVRDEPYRLFTARSENRLYIREDNAFVRMNKYRKQLGLTYELDRYLARINLSFDFYFQKLYSTYINPQDSFLTNNNIKVPRRTTVADIIKQGDLDPISIVTKYFKHIELVLDDRLLRSLAISIKYGGYIDKSKLHQDRTNRLDKKKVNWRDLMNSENISFECKLRIKKIQPITFGQLKQIEGIRQASIVTIASTLTHD